MQFHDQYDGGALDRFEDVALRSTIAELRQLFLFACTPPTPWEYDIERRPLATYIAIGVSVALRPNDCIPLVIEALMIPESRTRVLKGLAFAADQPGYCFDARLEPIVRDLTIGLRDLSNDAIFEIIACAVGLEKEAAQTFLNDLERRFGQTTIHKQVIQETREYIASLSEDSAS